MGDPDDHRLRRASLSGQPWRPSTATLFAGLALLIASETVFASVVPTVLSGRLSGGDVLVGIVVGSALGLGLLAVPVAVPYVECDRGRQALRWCAALLVGAGPFCLVGAWAPAGAVLVAALVFGAARAAGMFVLLTEVGRLGPSSPGQGYNSAAQRLGSAAGGLLAGWAIARGREEVAAAVLSAAAIAVVWTTRQRADQLDGPVPPRGAVRSAWGTTRVLLASDRAIQASLLLNVAVWLGIFLSGTMLPVALLQTGLERDEVGERVLLAVVGRDLVAVAVGALAWGAVRRVATQRVMVVVGLANATAALLLVVDGFSTRSLCAAAVLTGAAVAVGISCANVVATRGPADDIAARLAASQALAGIPIALIAVALVALLDPMGARGTMLANGTLALAVALVAAAACAAHDTGRQARISP